MLRRLAGSTRQTAIMNPDQRPRVSEAQRRSIPAGQGQANDEGGAAARAGPVRFNRTLMPGG